MVVKNFIFNENDNYKSVVLQSIDGDIKVLSLDNEKLFDINCSLDDIYGLKIRDFYKNNILLTSYKDICIINTNTIESKSVINQNDDFPSIKYIKLLDNNRYAIITYSNYRANPPIYKYLKIYDFQGKKIINKEFDYYVSYSNFISHNKIVTTSIKNPSKIINIDTDEVIKFDIGYTFYSDDVLIFDNEKYCIYINIDFHMNYYIECFDLSREENDRAIKIWKNSAPWVSKFKPLGYCKKDKHIYFIDKDKGEIVILEINKGNIVSLYKIEESIDDIKMSNSGEYIAWKLKTGKFSYIKYPFEAHKIENNKTWRRQYHYTNENDKVLLNPKSSVAELWWEAFNRINNTSFRSSYLNAHQLEPFNYSLSIPSISHLKEYNIQKAIYSFLGKGDKTDLKSRENLATIYHEIFHVFQTNAIQKALDYFYLIDDIQRKRVKLLKYLGYVNFCSLAENINSEFGKTIFHCVENYEKLSQKESYSEILDKFLTERYKEIDTETEELIKEYGIFFKDEILKQAQEAKINFKKDLENQIEKHITQIKPYSKKIKRISDLSKSYIEELIEMLALNKDTNLHLFHLIEGSAEIFGWYCAGYNIDKKFALRKKELTENGSAQTDTYERAYELFKEYGGKTPILFIIISLYSLSSKKSIDVFIYCLKKVKIWEEDLNILINQDELTPEIFKNIVLKLIKKVENSIRGELYNPNNKSIYDRNDNNSLFIKKLNNIRKEIPQSDKLEFLIDLVLDKSIISKLINSFEFNSKEFKENLRENEVMSDFEKFLMNNGQDIYLKCCSKHNIVNIFDDDIWLDCLEQDSFITILKDKFGINFPDKLKNDL